MKYFFLERDSIFCYEKSTIKELIKDLGLTEKVCFTAIKDEIADHIYCKEYRQVGSKSESCGKECPKYTPRNGKNGVCKFHSPCYEHDKEILIKV